MKTFLNQFVKKLIILTLFVGLLSFGATYLIPKQFVSPALPYLLIFFFGVSTYTFYLALKAFSQKTSRHANFFMISVFAKLLIYVAVIIAYAFINTGDILNFILTFFVYYLIFTVFETLQILKVQKLKK